MPFHMSVHFVVLCIVCASAKGDFPDFRYRAIDRASNKMG